MDPNMFNDVLKVLVFLAAIIAIIAFAIGAWVF